MICISIKGERAVNNKKTLNFPIITIYTFLLAGLAAAAQVALKGAPVHSGLVSIGEGLAQTGFSVAVIAVSILTVITNINDRRFFGITAGEYLKFSRKKLEPGFYDVLVIIVLLGALQYVALALRARYAAAVVFIEIITLMIIQIRWGLGIAFFYYDKEKQIRAFVTAEIEENLKIIAQKKANTKRIERAELNVIFRIDNLLAHTKNAVSQKETSQVSNNLSLIAHILELLFGNEYQSVWHNYETRVDSLLAQIIAEEIFSEFAVNSLIRMTDAVLATKESDDKQIAMNCDFDRTRNESYKMIRYANTRLLQHMFDKKLFYRLAAVKIYGITGIDKKAQRYSFYTDQFARAVSISEHTDEIKLMTIQGLKKIAMQCFEDGKATDAAIYFIKLIQSLAKYDIKTDEIWDELTENELENEEQQRSICMLKKAAGIKTDCSLSGKDAGEVSEFIKFISESA